MNDKPQRESDVSREISVDILNEIMDRAMPNIPDPPEEEPSGAQDPGETENVTRETSGTEKSSPSAKNKRASVYVYLAVLFGAAFLMLLLAYFVQQRNSDAVLDDLRSTTASRQELLEEIKALEEERDQLQADLEKQTTRNEKIRQKNEELEQKSEEYWDQLIRMTSWYDNSHIVDCLEQFNRSGDYLMAGIVVCQNDGMLNRNNPNASDKTLQYLTPTLEQRYMELREELFEKSGFMDYGYAEMPIIAKDAFAPEVLEAAQSLWAVIRNYAIAPDLAAWQLAECYRDSENLEQISSGVFQDSTIELMEQIKADLIAQGLLTERDDGTIDGVFLYGYGDFDIREVPVGNVIEEGLEADVSRETSEE